MLDSKLTVYKSWDLQQSTPKPHSHLYHLEPIGVGTPDVESLTGYVVRLAQEHCVSARKLIINEIAPLSRQQGCSDTLEIESISQIFGTDKRRAALNSTGLMAANLVYVLEALTLRQDLSFLTLLFWTQVLPTRGLLRRFRAWCPICYEQWRRTDNIIYEPLLWSIDAVKVCLDHCRLLSDKCPHCYQQLLVITGLSRPGYCDRCGKWLGSFRQAEAANSKILSESDWKWQTYVVNNVGQLIAAAPQLNLTPLRERIAKAIAAYINQVSQDNAAAFAQLVSVQHATLLHWLKGKAIPQMDKLLQLTHRLKTTLLDFLTQEVLAADENKKITPLLQQQEQRQRQPCKRLNIDRKVTLHAALTAFVKSEPPPSLEDVARRLECYPLVLQHHFPDLSHEIKVRHADYRKARQQAKIQPVLLDALDEAPPPSLQEIVRRLGHKNSSYLYQYFPELSREISRRYKQYLKTCGLEKRERICQEIRTIALELHESGEKPTNRRVASLLTKPGVLLNKYAQSALHEVRRSLGYD